MKIRMKNPAAVVPAALEPLMTLGTIVSTSPVPEATRELVHLRVSQINGCAVCIDLGLSKTKESVQRLAAVAVWQESPLFSEAERAALALAESVTRIADESERVPDAVWNEAARHYDDAALAALVLHVGVVNLYNRLNVATRQLAGQQSW
jgi:AhpD family alkylhydroperoxidase